jgi:hypothetical protein
MAFKLASQILRNKLRLHSQFTAHAPCFLTLLQYWSTLNENSSRISFRVALYLSCSWILIKDTTHSPFTCLFPEVQNVIMKKKWNVPMNIIHRGHFLWILAHMGQYTPCHVRNKHSMKLIHKREHFLPFLWLCVSVSPLWSTSPE